MKGMPGNPAATSMKLAWLEPRWRWVWRKSTANALACCEKFIRTPATITKTIHLRCGGRNTALQFTLQAPFVTGGLESSALGETPTQAGDQQQRRDAQHVQPPPRKTERFDDPAEGDGPEADPQGVRHLQPTEAHAARPGRKRLGGHGPDDRRLGVQEEPRRELAGGEDRAVGASAVRPVAIV